MLKKNPADQVHVVPSLKRHLGSRGLFSEHAVTVRVQGTVEGVCILQHSSRKTLQHHAYETSAVLKQIQHFAPASRNASRC